MRHYHNLTRFSRRRFALLRIKQVCNLYFLFGCVCGSFLILCISYISEFIFNHYF